MSSPEPTVRQWKEYTEAPVRSGNGIYVSLNPFGNFVLNRRAYAELGSPVSVTLLYDEASSTVGLKAAQHVGPNAFPLMERGRCGNRVVRALGFVREHHILPAYTIRFLQAGVEDGIMILDIKQSTRVTQTPRTGWRKLKTQRLLDGEETHIQPIGDDLGLIDTIVRDGNAPTD